MKNKHTSLIAYIVRLIVAFLYIFHVPLKLINKCWQFLQQYFYSYWINRDFGCEKCFFRYPVNAIIGEKYFKIGKECGFGKFAVITAWDSYAGETLYPEVIIGDYCNFGDYLHLTCINRIMIGSSVLTGRWVTITDNGHGRTDLENLKESPLARKLYSKGPVVIGDRVWIGDKVTILPGVTIGEGSVIGANSVVTSDIPPYSVACGNPAKIIKSITIDGK